MNFQELMKKRQSCRSYKDMPVEREKLMACMEAARISPSACNSQPWSFVLVDDPAIAKKMPMTMLNGLVPINRFTKDCNAYIVVIEEQANLSARLGGRYLDQEFAPIDLGLATQSICLAATEQGLGSCIMGFRFLVRWLLKTDCCPHLILSGDYSKQRGYPYNMFYPY